MARVARRPPHRVANGFKRFKRGRRRLAQAPAAPLAWPCVVIGVDTAKRSGYAVRVAGQLVESGEIQTDRDRVLILHAVRDAVARSAAFDFRVVLVLEKAWGGDPATLLALGAARERWIEAWVHAGQPFYQRVVDVYPSTWRARILGRAYASLPRDTVRAAELAVAASEVPFEGSDLGPDEAAAILISRWAAHAGEVGKVFDRGKPRRKTRKPDV